MKILVFDVVGKCAHFRKVYTNSSSLSYFVPPKTTINGILASVLGIERDTYYEDFLTGKVEVALKVMSPLRKMVHTINYMFYKTNSDLTNRVQGTQVPYELVASENDNLKYRIYVNMKDDLMFSQLINLIKNKKSRYIPSLGALPFSCKIDYIGIFESEEMQCNDIVEFDSIINMDCFVPNTLQIDKENIHLVKEQMPRNIFKDRNPDKLVDYLIEYSGNNLKLKVNSNYYKVNNENIVFM